MFDKLYLLVYSRHKVLFDRGHKPHLFVVAWFIFFAGEICIPYIFLRVLAQSREIIHFLLLLHQKTIQKDLESKHFKFNTIIIGYTNLEGSTANVVGLGEHRYKTLLS